MQVLFVEHLDPDIVESLELLTDTIDERLRIYHVGRLGAHISREVDALSDKAQVSVEARTGIVVTEQCDRRQRRCIHLVGLVTIEAIAPQLEAERHPGSRRPWLEVLSGPEHPGFTSPRLQQQRRCRATEVLSRDAIDCLAADTDQVDARVRRNTIKRQRRTLRTRE